MPAPAIVKNRKLMKQRLFMIYPPSGGPIISQTVLYVKGVVDRVSSHGSAHI
jgi:hypothetical protein